jgi:hypothetical protein
MLESTWDVWLVFVGVVDGLKEGNRGEEPGGCGGKGRKVFAFVVPKS